MRVRWLEEDKPDYMLFRGGVYRATLNAWNNYVIDQNDGAGTYASYIAMPHQVEVVPETGAGKVELVDALLRGGLLADPKLGAKYDTGKARYSLYPRGMLAGVVKVLEFGAKKYAENSWQRVPDAVRRYRDALDRHWDAATGTGLCSGHEAEANDPESGLAHAYHFLCCATFLAWFLVHRPEAVVEYRRRVAEVEEIPDASPEQPA